MAKPIPVNRRFLENHQGAVPTPPVSAPSQGEDLDWDDEDESEFEDEELDLELETLGMWDEEEELDASQWADKEGDFHPEQRHEAYTEQEDDAPIIAARYSGTCPVCGNPTRVGDRITRHANMDAWVHVGCRYNQSLTPFRSLVARYDGYCRLCRQPFPAGQVITNLSGYGWVHLECARRHQAHD